MNVLHFINSIKYTNDVTYCYLVNLGQYNKLKLALLIQQLSEIKIDSRNFASGPAIASNTNVLLQNDLLSMESNFSICTSA